MQLLLILGVAFAIVAVVFSLQNHAVVTVTFALWSFEGSLAVVLLLTLGLGMLIAGLVSSPTMIRDKWAANGLRRRVKELEATQSEKLRRIDELQAQLDRLAPRPETPEPKPYVGLTEILARDPSRESNK